jgi:hypothetical protein
VKPVIQIGYLKKNKTSLIKKEKKNLNERKSEKTNNTIKKTKSNTSRDGATIKRISSKFAKNNTNSKSQKKKNMTK